MKTVYLLVARQSEFMSHELTIPLFAVRNKKQLDALIKRVENIKSSFTSKDDDFTIYEIQVSKKSKELIVLNTNNSDMNYGFNDILDYKEKTEDNIISFEKQIIKEHKKSDSDATFSIEYFEILDSLTTEQTEYVLKEYIANDFKQIEYLNKVKTSGIYYTNPDFYESKAWKIGD